MANSKVGNYQLEYNLTGYIAPIRSHTHAIYVAPTGTPSAGATPASIDIQLLGGGTDTLENVANTYGDFVRRMYSPDVLMGQWTLWRYATENARDFITAGSLTLATTPSGTLKIAQQETLTYRTAGGGILKQVFIEAKNGGDLKEQLQPDATGSDVDRLAFFTLSAGSPVIGIDNTFPVAPLFNSRGQNERVWRKIYRQ